MNAIKSIIQQNKKWSVKNAAATSSFLAVVVVVVVVPTSAYLLQVLNQEQQQQEEKEQKQNGNENAIQSQRRNNEETADRAIQTNHRQRSTLYDIAKDWTKDYGDEDKHHNRTTTTPDSFLKDFIFTRNRNNNDQAQNNKEEETNQLPDDPSTAIDLFKILFSPSSPQLDSVSSTTHDETNANTNTNDNDCDNTNSTIDDLIESTLSSMNESVTELLTGQVSDRTFTELINHARNKSQSSNNIGSSNNNEYTSTSSFTELINIIINDIKEVKQKHEDEKKNPSYKRRMHRFYKSVHLNQVNYLNDALKLAELSYADTVGEIKSTLESGRLQIRCSNKSSNNNEQNEKYELIYCQLDSYPGKPSHYLAVKRNQSIWSPSLEIVLVVRGTKTVPDILTDALLDATDYKDGKAHAGILESGKYLVEKHSNMMESLLQLSKKKQIKLFIVGHSLGAGAATIAGMELYDNPLYDVSVIGFGCPALLSKELSESTASYVTTVIGDSDIVPRMSAATIGNVILNILEYDWTSKAKRDVNQALQELFFKKTSFLFSNEIIQSIRQAVDEQIMDFVKTRVKQRTDRRVEPTLFPPGNCIHFYRDGIAVSGAFTPATFFREIDISRTMVDDHYISGYRRIFLDVMRNFHKDDHFSFERRKGN